MGRMVPELAANELSLLRSGAEARFYAACRDQLPEDWTTLFSVPWVGTTVSGRRYDGEADFIIFAPNAGMLVVEVKGGGVSYDQISGKWFSTDRNGSNHEIKDPFRQVVAEKHAVIAILRQDPRWKRVHYGRLLAGHAVLLADVDRIDGMVSPQSPRQILGGRKDLASAREWVEGVLAYWAGDSDDSTPLGHAAIATAREALTGRLNASPLVSVQLASEEGVRIELTEQQGRVLRAIGSRRRAAICGGAGTGKTLLAIERARALAALGKSVLLVCYNRLLADFFKASCAGVENLHAMTYHQLCEWRASVVRARTGADVLEDAKRAFPSRSSRDLFDVQLPYALALACERSPERYDAIIVDEGQDFREEFWFGLQMLLRDEQESCLYVFFDQNQSLYTALSGVPIAEPPFVLTFNCRNTSHIHECAYQYFTGEQTDPPPGNVGVPVETMPAPSLKAQATGIHAAIVRLLTQEQVRPDQVAVLVCGEPKSEYFENLRDKVLPKGVAWEIEAPAMAQGVRVDTVRRFKGLESDVVFLWGLDGTSMLDERELLYVGISRAKSRLILVGTRERLSSLIPRAKANLAT